MSQALAVLAYGRGLVGWFGLMTEQTLLVAELNFNFAGIFVGF